MTRLTDDELRRHVGRRANRQPLSADDRRALLASIAGTARAHRRPIYLFGWPVAGVGSAAAAVLVLAVAGSLLLPRVLPSPGPAGSPGIASPTPSTARPSESPAELGLRIYTTSQASELAADPDNEGRVVIVALDPRWPCPGDVSCADEGFIAVRLNRDAAHVGGVRLLDGARPWTVTDVVDADDTLALGMIAVDGWLVRAPGHMCDWEDVDDQFRCGAEVYITPDSEQIAQRTTGGGIQIAEPATALRVQNGAYEAFADAPLVDGDGLWAPRRGIYLVWPYLGAGPRLSAQVRWELVARIEPPLATQLEPTATPSVSGSQHEILGAVAEWVADEESASGSPLYVHSVVADVGFLMNTYGPGARDPDLRDVGSPLFEGEMTESTIEAIGAALDPIGAEFIADPAAVRAPDQQPGVCDSFLGGRRLLQFGPPRPNGAGDGFFVTVQVGDGCYGSTRVVEVIEADGEYRVTRTVIEATFIVD
jgi:hypothetical protein